MSAQMQEREVVPAPNADIEIVSNALVKFDRVATGLVAMKEKFADVIYPVATTAGMADAKAARAELRETRLEVERIRLDAKRPLLAIGKKLDAEAKRITEVVEPLESGVDSQIKAHEAIKEAERQAKIEAERKRVAQIQSRIDDIRLLPLRAINNPADKIEALLDEAQAIVIDDRFEEFTGTAAITLQRTLTEIARQLDERRIHEAEHTRLANERAALAAREREHEERVAADNKRAEEAKRIEDEARQQRIRDERRQEEEQRAKIAEENRLAKVKRDAEVAAAQEKLRAERAESERQDAERSAALDVELRKLAEARMAFDAKQEAARIAALPPPVSAPVEMTAFASVDADEEEPAAGADHITPDLPVSLHAAFARLYQALRCGPVTSFPEETFEEHLINLAIARVEAVA